MCVCVWWLFTVAVFVVVAAAAVSLKPLNEVLRPKRTREVHGAVLPTLFTIRRFLPGVYHSTLQREFHLILHQNDTSSAPHLFFRRDTTSCCPSTWWMGVRRREITDDSESASAFLESAPQLCALHSSIPRYLPRSRPFILRINLTLCSSQEDPSSSSSRHRRVAPSPHHTRC